MQRGDSISFNSITDKPLETMKRISKLIEWKGFDELLDWEMILTTGGSNIESHETHVFNILWRWIRSEHGGKQYSHVKLIMNRGIFQYEVSVNLFTVHICPMVGREWKIKVKYH